MHCTIVYILLCHSQNPPCLKFVVYALIFSLAYFVGSVWSLIYMYIAQLPVLCCAVRGSLCKCWKDHDCHTIIHASCMNCKSAIVREPFCINFDIDYSKFLSEVTTFSLQADTFVSVPITITDVGGSSLDFNCNPGVNISPRLVGVILSPLENYHIIDTICLTNTSKYEVLVDYAGIDEWLLDSVSSKSHVQPFNQYFCIS